MKRLLMVCLLLVGSCAADNETRQGEINEFCRTGDSDCRAGLVCEQGICQLSGPQPQYGCDQVCAKLESCGVAEPSCVADCRVTTRDWSLAARELFGTCAVIDISCEEAQNVFVPQVCYERIPLPPARRDLCDLFIQVAVECSSSAPIGAIETACYRFGRVSEASQWATTEQCERAIGVGICSGIATCYNDVFSMNPRISLGQGNLNNSSEP